MSLGSKIKTIANEKQISMYRIAKETNISNSYLSELVNDIKKNPSLAIVKKIADILEVSIEDLIS